MVWLGVAKLGVHEDEREVGEEVGDAHQDAVKEDEGEDEVVVLGSDSGDEVLSHAGDEEDVFDYERAGDDGGEGGAEVGDRGHEGGTQGVLGDDLQGRHALGASGADVVLRENVEHAAAGESGEVGCDPEGEGDGGENDVGGSGPTGDVEPTERLGDIDLEEGPENKGDDTDSCHGDEHGEVVKALVVIERGNDAQGDSDENAEDEGDETEHHGDWKGLRDEVGDFAPFHGEGIAEVAFG